MKKTNNLINNLKINKNISSTNNNNRYDTSMKIIVSIIMDNNNFIVIQNYFQEKNTI